MQQVVSIGKLNPSTYVEGGGRDQVRHYENRRKDDIKHKSAWKMPMWAPPSPFPQYIEGVISYRERLERRRSFGQRPVPA